MASHRRIQLVSRCEHRFEVETSKKLTKYLEMCQTVSVNAGQWQRSVLQCRWHFAGSLVVAACPDRTLDSAAASLLLYIVCIRFYEMSARDHCEHSNSVCIQSHWHLMSADVIWKLVVKDCLPCQTGQTYLSHVLS